MPSSFFDKLKDSIGVEDIEPEPEEEKEEEKKKSPKKKVAAKTVKKIAVKDGSKPEKEEEEKKKRESDWFEESDGELAIDVYQTKNEIVVQTAVAGVKADDLDVSIENDLVTIAGKRESHEVEEEKNYFFQECYWGAFSREIILPEEVDASRAEAMFKDGILTLRLPKTKRQKTKKIKVKG